MDLLDLPPAGSIAGRASAALRKACHSAAFSYGLVFALQLKLIWQIWRYRDMTAGDTASYFSSAYLWATHLQTNFVWSPLYTAYAALGDAYDATILHRALIAVPDGFPWLVVGTKAETADSLLLIRKSDGVSLPPSLPAIDCNAWQPETKETP
jgi:hypothetical protein